MSDVEDKARRYWGPERNEARRKRYKDDPEYRNKIREQVRDTYRRQRMEQGLPVRTSDCRENIGDLDMIGEERMVVLKSGEEVDMLTFTVAELAKALERSQQVMYRWFTADQFPRPVVQAMVPTNHQQPVYSFEEAKALLNVFGEHQEESQYYRKVHTATRDKLYAAVALIRNRMRVQGVPMEDDND